MYNLLFDSDALIKLMDSEALIDVCKACNCLTTSEVKREVVDEGKRRMYQDADLIDRLFRHNLIKIRNPKKTSPLPPWGTGELSVLSLQRETKDCIIVSDERAFLKELEREEVDFLVPVDIIILLYRRKKIDAEQAREYLEGMRIYIRKEDYRRIKNGLKEG